MEIVLFCPFTAGTVTWQAQDGAWTLTVDMIEMLGAERLVYTRLGDSLFTVRMNATLMHPKLGDTVKLRVTPEHLHWFDAQTHERIG